MPRLNKEGPPKGATGPRDGSGKGKGNYSRNKSGTGAKTGGKRGIRPNKGEK
jgi:hypothetical protein